MSVVRAAVGPQTHGETSQARKAPGENAAPPRRAGDVDTSRHCGGANKEKQ
ncbi:MULTISPECIES: hypothetical protein [unclassified Streptomyces]|uniref:hypothetical protein n=1 Tax=unclassified Streptomyces TaxID=2593676 RepID=UPI0015E0AC9F|nr:hypothetical protein [Streptomyces sp. CB02959]